MFMSNWLTALRTKVQKKRSTLNRKPVATAASPLRYEPLEERRLLSATPVGDVLPDTQTDIYDTVTVSEALKDAVSDVTSDTQLNDIADTENPVTFLELEGTQQLAVADTANASNDPAANQVGLAIDVNPTNPLNVVGASHNIGTKQQIDVLVSLDGGASFETTVLDDSVDGLNRWAKRFDVATAFDADGNLYVAYGVNEGAGSNTSVVVARSQDGGQTFNQVSVVDVQRNIGEGQYSEPGAEGFRLATGIDPLSGREAVYISYTQNVTESYYGYDRGYDDNGYQKNQNRYSPVDERIVVAGSNNAGAGWTDPTIVNDGSIRGTDKGNGFADVAVGPEGELYVSWFDEGAGYANYPQYNSQVDYGYNPQHDSGYGQPNYGYGQDGYDDYRPKQYDTSNSYQAPSYPTSYEQADRKDYKPADGYYSVTYSHPASIQVDVDRDGLFSTNDSFGKDVTATDINTNLQQVWASVAPKQGIHNGPVIDVDRSGGDYDGRVYITFADTVQPQHVLAPVVTEHAKDATQDGYEKQNAYQKPQVVIPYGNADADVFVISSNNETASWSDRIQVNSHSSGSTEFHPWVDVDQTSGSVNVLYYSSAGDEATGNDDVHVKVATSTDGGWSFPATQSNRLTTETSNAVLNPSKFNFHNYIGVAAHDGTLHALWADNSNDVKGFEAFTATVAYSSASDANILEVDGDANGPTADNFILRRSASNQQFIELLLNEEVVFAGLSASVDGIAIDGHELADTLTVDFTNGNPIPWASGVTFNGNDPGMPADGDALRIVGGADATYTPDSATNGSGEVVVDGDAINFTGLEETVYFDGTDAVTLVTPNAADVVSVDDAAVDKTVVSGTSDGVGFNSATFQNVTSFTVDAASNDAVDGTSDDVTISTPLVATGLQNFTLSTGGGDDTITSGSDFALPEAGGAFTIDAGDGADHLNSTGDANFTLSDADLATTGPEGGGSAVLNSTVETAVLTGGDSSNTIDASGFTGETTLVGGAGNDTLTGGQSNDDIYGGTGSDLVIWTTGLGSDRVEGGAGESDQIEVTTGDGDDTVVLTAGSDSDPNNPTRVALQVSNAAGTSVLDLASIEDATLVLGDGADSLQVNDLAGTHLRSLDANLGNDDAGDSVTVEGRQTSDNITVAGHGGGDVSVDGLTADINLSSVIGDTIIVNANDGDDQLYSNNTAGVANVTLNGDRGDDAIDADANAITGGAGNDTITGRGFVDRNIEGGSGDDVLTGGSGVDNIDGGSGDDVLVGGAGDDSLTDLQGNNSFDGGAGDDELIAGAGDDSFVLEDGNDQISAGAGFDTLAISTGGDDDVVAVSQNIEGITTIVNGVSQTDTVARGSLEEVTISTGAGDDLIGIRVSDQFLTEGTPEDSSRFELDAGGSRTADRLAVLDDGPGDLTIHREYSDNGAGTVRVGGLDPINYTNVETVNVLPLDPVTGATGADGNGRVLVVDTDPFEHNNDRLNPTDLTELAAAPVNPNIDPAGVVDPFGFGTDLPGDEDWYEFHATKTGTYEFEIEFDVIGDLANGRDGLPDDGQLVISAYDADGGLISNSVVSQDGQAVTIGVEDGSTSYLRVDGLTEDVFNVYDIHITEVDLNGPRVFDPDGDGEERHGVEITDHPDFNLFDVKPSAGPTPGVESITINIEDTPGRFPGFLYEALNSDVSSNPGHYHLVGDNNGIVAIDSVIVTNGPVAEGDVPTATIELVFDSPIPDDRYTLTLSDSIADPADNQLDGETNADEPNGNPAFPSGDGVAGGDFVARFTVDSRPEIATIGAGPRKGSGLQTGIYVDTNGNFEFDPKSGDHSNRDLVFEFGTENDRHFAGQFSTEGATSVDGFDRLGAYGSVTEVIGQYGKRAKTQQVYRWLLDFDNDGVADYNKVAEMQLSGRPITGDFDRSTPGDEVGLFGGTYWYLDSDHSNDIEKSDTILRTNMGGIPLVGDFDGDGKDDLATYLDQRNGKFGRETTFFFDLTSADDGTPGELDGHYDDKIDFKLAGQSNEVVPFSADFNIDGIDDIGLKEVNRRGVTPSDQAEWFFLMSQPADAEPGTANALDHAFSPAPLGNDMFAQFGHNDALPLVGNFDPPVTNASNTAQQAPLTSGDDSTAVQVDEGELQTMPLNNDGELRFDFDVEGSDTYWGAVSVKPNDSYSNGAGYGWSGAVAGQEFDVGAKLMGDGHAGSNATFKVNVPNGTYEVLVIAGDEVARDGLQISAEGKVAEAAFGTRAGEFVAKSFNVTVVDGQLSINFEDVGGSNNGWNISGLRLRQLSSAAGLDAYLSSI